MARVESGVLSVPGHDLSQPLQLLLPSRHPQQAVRLTAPVHVVEPTKPSRGSLLLGLFDDGVVKLAQFHVDLVVLGLLHGGVIVPGQLHDGLVVPVEQKLTDSLVDEKFGLVRSF